MEEEKCKISIIQSNIAEIDECGELSEEDEKDHFEDKPDDLKKPVDYYGDYKLKPK